MKLSFFHQIIFLICCILTFMPVSKIEAIEDTDIEYLGTAKEIVPCPGDDRGDRKCNHDPTHRVCARLVDNTNGQCKRLNWGTENFWQITHQEEWDWHELICSNETRPELGSKPKPSGEHWCICMWATEGLINEVGCENVHFQCDATDVNYILGKYLDRDVSGKTVEITNAKCCMLQKCGAYITKKTKDDLEKNCP